MDELLDAIQGFLFEEAVWIERVEEGGSEGIGGASLGEMGSKLFEYLVRNLLDFMERSLDLMNVMMQIQDLNEHTNKHQESNHNIQDD